MATQYRDFESAREFARSLNLKGDKEWREYCKSGNKPEDVPSRPDVSYKKDYKDLGDFLGTGNVATQARIHLSFTEAREFARSLGLKGVKEWREYYNSNKMPHNISSRPDHIYKNKEWLGWGDFLGTGNVATQARIHLSFTEAREFAKKLKLKNLAEWNDYCTSGNKPEYVPSHPNGTYKKEFKGYGDFLGTGNISPKDKAYRSFKEAREFVRALKLKNNKEWVAYCKSGNKPDDIPSTPRDVYKSRKRNERV
jgi:hypothetical protein